MAGGRRRAMRALAVLGAAAVGVGVGIAAWRLLPEGGGEPSAMPPLWGPDTMGVITIRVGSGELRRYPVRSREECEAARAELAWLRELVVGQNERNLQNLIESKAHEADEIGTLFAEHMEFFRLERRWWDEQEAKALARLDAGCPDDGIRGVMRESPEGEAEGYVLFEPGVGSFADWMANNWDSLPEWLRSRFRTLVPNFPTGE